MKLSDPAEDAAGHRRATRISGGRLRRHKLRLLLSLIPLTALLWYANPYRSALSASLAEARHASIPEIVAGTRFSWYWFEFMDRLRFDPEAGIYSFPASPPTAAPSFEEGKLAWHRGDFPHAIAAIEADIKTHGDNASKLFWLALSHLRLAEERNCLTTHEGRDRGTAPNHTADHPLACSLPLKIHHTQKEHSRKAAAILRRLLDEYDPDDGIYRWLLNFSYMTVGGFPHEVPAEHLLDTPFIERFHGASGDAARRRVGHLVFTDRAAELGVDSFNSGKGVAVEDFDRDGFLDLVTGGTFSPLKFYHNAGGHRFADRTAELGLAGVTAPHIVTAADYDNDGFVDLLVYRTFQELRLFKNRRGEGFEDVTLSSGLFDSESLHQVNFSWISDLSDVDLDGDLDLFLALWSHRYPIGVFDQPGLSSRLLINDGGVFTDRTADFGLERFVRGRNYVGVAFGDVDDDLDPDLFLTGFETGRTVLLENLGGRAFRDAGLGWSEKGFTASFLDADHDGDLDLFVGGVTTARAATERGVLDRRHEDYDSGFSTLLRNTENGFAASRGFLHGQLPFGSMGASFGDLDNDGCHDFYLGTGTPEGWFVLPNVMLLGVAEGTGCSDRVVDISMTNGFGTLQKGHGIVFFDFDNDGDQDVYSSLGGMWPGDAWPNQLFVNESELANRSVSIRLRGRRTNRYGVDARIKVSARNARGEEIVRHHVIGNKTGFGSAPYLAHAGLLDAVGTARVEVVWPASGTTRVYSVELDRRVVLDEDGGEPGPEEAE